MKNLKIILVLSLIITMLSIIPSSIVFAEDDTVEETLIEEEKEREEENLDKTSGEYKEEEIENYTFDEDGAMIGTVEDSVVYKNTPAPRAIVNYGKGYLDFMGSSSQVLNVYPSATSSSAYTYFNTGSGERVATLGQSGSRVKIVINGYVGWINKSNYVQNAKWYSVSSLSSNYTEYYTKNSSGALVYTYAYYETTQSIVVGNAPDFMSTGTKYYSLDGIYYYTNRSTMFNDKASSVTTNSINKSNPYFNYYQYLPFRSGTNLTVDDFYSFIKGNLSSTNFNKSVLNNKTALNQFFLSEEAHSVNAALEFSMALLESGYGTSQIARDKNNLFGWGAVDSGPYAGAYKYDSVNTGIEYHVKSAISSGYLDSTQDFRYYGGNVGNKNNGLNVKYASDPYWGMKIAGIYYSLDKKSGFKDYNNYKIAVQNKGASTPAYYNGSLKYYLKNNYSNTAITNMPFLVVGENSSQYSILSDVPVCNPGDSKYFYFINQSTLKVDKKYYSCKDYDVHFASDAKFNEDIVQVSKSKFTLTGNSNTVKPGDETNTVVKGDIVYVLNNDNKILYAYKIESNGNIPTYYEFNGNVTVDNALNNIKYKFNMNTTKNTIINAEYHLNGKVKKYYEYLANTKYGSHGSRIQYVFDMNTSNDTINYVQKQYYGKVVRYYTYQPNTKYGTHGSRKEYVYIMRDNIIAYAEHYIDGKKKYIYEFNNDTKFDGNQLSKKKYVFNINPNNTIKNAYKLNSYNKIERYYEYAPGTKHGGLSGNHGGKVNYVFIMNLDTLNIEYAYRIANRKVQRYYEYESNTKYGEHGSKVIARYDTNGYNNSIVLATKNDGSKQVKYEYYSPVSYSARNTNIKNVFNIENGHIINGEMKNRENKTVRYYEYQKYTSYGTHASKLKYVFNVIEDTDVIIDAYLVNYKWDKLRRYTYIPGTRYDVNGLHGKYIISSNPV